MGVLGLHPLLRPPQRGQPRRFLDHAKEIGVIRNRAFPVDVDAWIRELRETRPLSLAAKLAPRPLLLTYNANDNCCFKADHALPVTGCIKARGGVYEVLCVAERIGLPHDDLHCSHDKIARCRELTDQPFPPVRSSPCRVLGIANRNPTVAPHSKEAPAINTPVPIALRLLETPAIPESG